MVIDVIFAIVAGYGFYIGFSRGIIKTVFTVISVIFGVIAAFRFGPFMTEVLESTFNSDNPLMFLAGFLLAFVLTMVLIRMFSSAIENVLESANINIINQAAGGILTAGTMVLIYSVMLWFGDKSHLINNEAKRESMTYDYIEHFPEQVWAVGKQLKPTFENFWDHSIDFMDELEEMSLQRSEDSEIFDIEEDE